MLPPSPSTPISCPRLSVIDFFFFLLSLRNKMWGSINLPVSMAFGQPHMTTSFCDPEFLTMARWECRHPLEKPVASFSWQASPLESLPEVYQFPCHLHFLTKKAGERGWWILQYLKTQQNLCGHCNYYYAELMNSILSFFWLELHKNLNERKQMSLL